MTGLTWTPPLMQITFHIDKWGKDVDAAAAAMVERYAAVIPPEMKNTHPWQNRSRDAELMLFAETEHGAHEHTLRFGGKAEHQQYLEWRFDWNGRWAIVRPTFAKYTNIIRRDIQETFGK